MKRIALFSAAASIALLSTPAFAGQELVKNGGFESVTRTGASISSTDSYGKANTGNFELGGYAGSNNSARTLGTLDNWTFTASTTAPLSSAYNLLFNTAANGNTNAAGTYSYTGNEYLRYVPTGTAAHNNFLVLDGDTNVNAVLSQTIGNLNVGQTYTLTFDWATSQIDSRNGAATDGLTVNFGTGSFSTGQQTIPTGWQTVTHNFVATSASQTLSFLSVGTPNGLPPVALLDNVSVQAAVPEPATWAMMLIGFAMVGAGARYRRRNTSAAIA